MINNRCLVAIKKVINPYVSIKVKEDLSGVIKSNVRMSMNPFDEIALQEAVRLKEQGALDFIMVVSIGDNCQDILKQALASGADSALFIKTDQELTSLNIAKILKYLVLENNINIVLLGKQAIDDDCNQTGQMLAGLLKWSQACFVSKIFYNHDIHDKQALEIEREVDIGVEKCQIHFPIVITILDQKTDLPKNMIYVSVANLMKANKKVIDAILLQDLHIDNLNFNNIKVLKTYLTPKKPIHIQVSSVNELLDKLKHHDKVI